MKHFPAKRPLRLLLTGALALPLVVCQLAWAQRGPAVVEVTEIVEREVAEQQTFVGTVIPSRRATVGSAVDGRVVSFLVEEGDRVQEGEALAELLTETINLELEAAQKELVLREQQEAELTNGSRPDEIEQARARVEAVKASLDYVESERKRVERLVSERAVSPSEYDRIVSLYLETQKRLVEAEAAYRLVVEGPRAERIAQARAQAEMQDAVVRKLQDQIKKHTIISRFTGYVAAEHTEVGQWVTRGDPVAEVIALDTVEVVAKVVESQIPHIQLGDSVHVEIPALPQDPFKGSVSAVVPEADTRSRTFPVKVTIENEIADDGTPSLKSGMLARVTLRTGPKVNAMLVPKDALVLNGDDAFVWLVDPATISEAANGQVTANVSRIPVETGVADGELIQIAELTPAFAKPGAIVVVKGNERIPYIPGRPSQVTWTTTTNSPANSVSTR